MDFVQENLGEPAPEETFTQTNAHMSITWYTIFDCWDDWNH